MGIDGKSFFKYIRSTQKFNKTCTHKFDLVALICACCVVNDPNCTTIPKNFPDGLDYSKCIFAKKCSQCEKKLKFHVVQMWFTRKIEFVFNIEELSEDDTSKEISINDYPKSLVESIKYKL